MDLAELKNVEVAGVYKGSLLAGELHRRRDRTEYLYTPDYLRAGAPPVATTQ